MYLLKDRITTKAKKCERKLGMDEYWLALFNHYWVADEESYHLAYGSINIEHDFDKIFIVDGNQELFLL